MKLDSICQFHVSQVLDGSKVKRCLPAQWDGLFYWNINSRGTWHSGYALGFQMCLFPHVNWLKLSRNSESSSDNQEDTTLWWHFIPARHKLLPGMSNLALWLCKTLHVICRKPLMLVLSNPCKYNRCVLIWQASMYISYVSDSLSVLYITSSHAATIGPSTEA